jgi:hypothetical protein
MQHLGAASTGLLVKIANPPANKTRKANTSTRAFKFLMIAKDSNLLRD